MCDKRAEIFNTSNRGKGIQTSYIAMHRVTLGELPMETRQPAVAGLFYADDPTQLSHDVDRLLHKHTRPILPGVRALVVPHAGYAYSGDVAAAAYSCLTRGAEYKYILLIGPSHRVPFKGMAVPESGAFMTPLGDIPLARAQIDALVADDLVRYNSAAHFSEHSLEVQLPFLQRAEIRAPILPVVIGDASPEQVARVLLPALENSQVLTLISTDMSHFHSYYEARLIDGHTHKRILAGAEDIRPDEACGCMGLNGLQHALAQSSYRMHLLQHGNSGDTAGDQDRVVGYAAYAVY